MLTRILAKDDVNFQTFLDKSIRPHLKNEEEISIHFYMYISFYAKFLRFNFDVNIRQPIKTEEKRI